MGGYVNLANPPAAIRAANSSIALADPRLGEGKLDLRGCYCTVEDGHELCCEGNPTPDTWKYVHNGTAVLCTPDAGVPQDQHPLAVTEAGAGYIAMPGQIRVTQRGRTCEISCASPASSPEAALGPGPAPGATRRPQLLGRAAAWASSSAAASQANSSSGASSSFLVPLPASMNPQDDLPCAGCGKGTPESPAAPHKPCSRCKSVRYCSEQCSVSHWPQHKLACKAEQAERARVVAQQAGTGQAVATARPCSSDAGAAGSSSAGASSSTSAAPAAVLAGAACAACGKPPAAGKAHLRCSGCKQIRLCSPECQKAIWPQHKAACKAAQAAAKAAAACMAGVGI